MTHKKYNALSVPDVERMGHGVFARNRKAWLQGLKSLCEKSQIIPSAAKQFVE